MIINYKITETIIDDLFTLDELKNYLRVSHDYDDQLIVNLSITAINHAENIIGISIYKKRIIANIIKAELIFKLRYPKITEIKSVVIIEQDDKENITDSYGFFDQNTSQLFLNAQYKNQNIEIEYLSSHSAQEIPHPIKQGLLMHIALMFEYSDNNAQITAQIKDLYQPYRILKV